jgi:uncharacterized membrane protein YraQ (UPF0718 family)
MVASEPASRRPRDAWARWGVVLFTVIAVGGLFYAKWDPYYHKAFLAAAKHSIGASIISGTAAAAPAPGWQAAIHFAVSYGLAIWEALAVGLLVGAGVQVLLPRDWLLRVLGRAGFSSTAIGGLAAVPAMM